MQTDIANNVNPDQAAPAWSGSTLFVKTCLSKNTKDHYIWYDLDSKLA